ncbi:acyltransferase family protein [Tundrisphaera sp. TA3]|uniref:acyltransferase family protein n=1 Tax=Tundrisphaera sp. TA3 TaxID=3435775 RepID=UPI003EBFFB99
MTIGAGPDDVRAEPRRQPEGAAPSPFYIPSLDGIRAVAFLMVFVGHAGWGHIVPGGLGVTIFFFLSGYLITTLMRREADRSGTVSLKHFYARRCLRIFPPFYLVLGVSTLATVLFAPADFRPLATLAQAFQLTNYYLILFGREGIPLGLVVAWSLAVEEHFYLLFPPLYLGLRKWLSRRAQAMTLLALCGAILAWRCLLVYGFGAGETRTYEGTDTRADSILFGCILALQGNPVLDPPRYGLGGRRSGRLLFVGGLLALLFSLVVRDPRFRETFRYSIQGLALIPIFDAAIRHPDAPLFRALNFRWVRFLGVLSYSLYLLHFSILILVGAFTPLPKVATAVVSLALSLVLSYAIFVLIEQPFARMRKSFRS